MKGSMPLLMLIFLLLLIVAFTQAASHQRPTGPLI
jgi:hypothetical protein